MWLERVTNEESIIKEALIKLTEEISDDYLKINEISMDAKMYLSLNQLYLKKKREKNLS